MRTFHTCPYRSFGQKCDVAQRERKHWAFLSIPACFHMFICEPTGPPPGVQTQGLCVPAWRNQLDLTAPDNLSGMRSERARSFSLLVFWECYPNTPTVCGKQLCMFVMWEDFFLQVQTVSLHKKVYHNMYCTTCQIMAFLMGIEQREGMYELMLSHMLMSPWPVCCIIWWCIL